MEKTLAIIKPDAVERGISGEILTLLAGFGFKVVDMKMVRMQEYDAKYIYDEHKDKEFFPELVNFMTSSPSIFLVLERKNAIEAWRDRMGPPDVGKAKCSMKATVRGKHGILGRPKRENVVHGSDSPESAARELNYFYEEIFYSPPAAG